MADLVAQGPHSENFWRRTLPRDNATITLGRSVAKSQWAVPWDALVSGLHAELTWGDGKLFVRKRPDAKNAVFCRGEPSDEFSLAPGDVFVIGETTFSLDGSGSAAASDAPLPQSEFTCSADELRLVPYTDADQRIEVLAALPEVIRYSPSDDELEVRVVDVLLRGIPRAEAAAVVRLQAAPGTEGAVEIRSFERRGRGSDTLRPSRRLIDDAIRRRRQSVMHIWHVGETSADFTVGDNLDWAICAPLPDDPHPGWGLYVAGRLPAAVRAAGDSLSERQLKSDLKFAELVAEVFGALRQVSHLQRRQGHLSRFFSVPVLAALAERDIDEVLRPRQASVTVLFCDLRGSCRITEAGQHDLASLWERISQALGIMTSGITDHDGVIGDFQGDAAMGFWGWPLEDSQTVEKACRAALAIRRRFAREARQPGHPLAGFACGLGIASGPAIAGRLGTSDQFKVSVFGPVVNLASRLESMTKQFCVPVLVDEATAEQLRGGPALHWARLRRLATVQPYGMQKTLMVSELLPPAVEPGECSDRNLRDYEAALDAFHSGRWDDCQALLRRLPNDGAAEFLRGTMEQHGGRPPTGWTGVVPLEGK